MAAGWRKGVCMGRSWRWRKVLIFSPFILIVSQKIVSFLLHFHQFLLLCGGISCHPESRRAKLELRKLPTGKSMEMRSSDRQLNFCSVLSLHFHDLPSDTHGSRSCSQLKPIEGNAKVNRDTRETLNWWGITSDHDYFQYRGKVSLSRVAYQKKFQKLINLSFQKYTYGETSGRIRYSDASYRFIWGKRMKCFPMPARHVYPASASVLGIWFILLLEIIHFSFNLI